MSKFMRKTSIGTYNDLEAYNCEVVTRYLQYRRRPATMQNILNDLSRAVSTGKNLNSVHDTIHRAVQLGIAHGTIRNDNGQYYVPETRAAAYHRRVKRNARAVAAIRAKNAEHLHRELSRDYSVQSIMLGDEDDYEMDGDEARQRERDEERDYYGGNAHIARCREIHPVSMTKGSSASYHSYVNPKSFAPKNFPN